MVGLTRFFGRFADQNGPDIYLQPEDHLSAEVLPYKENKVFVWVFPKVLKSILQTRNFADVLFTSGGPLSIERQRSEVYLLRGTNPVVAYHLMRKAQLDLLWQMQWNSDPMIYYTLQSNPLSRLTERWRQLYPSGFYYAIFRMRISPSIKS